MKIVSQPWAESLINKLLNPGQRAARSGWSPAGKDENGNWKV